MFVLIIVIRESMGGTGSRNPL